MAWYFAEGKSGESAMYDLKAVVRHFESGHFKAYIRIDGSTWCFDDRLVT
jgi:hypothetical protein